MDVQSLFVDGNNVLWILDSPAPFSKVAQPIGAKLVGIDLRSDRVKKIIVLDKAVLPQNSYLRNICVDQWGSYAYISDAGTGALVVTDLNSGVSRRVLSADPSTKAEQGALRIGGQELRDDQGNPRRFQVDGIALDEKGANLYYHALSAHTLYRIQTRYLNDPTLSGEELGKHVEWLSDTGFADGIALDSDYNLFLTDPEENSIKRYRVYDNSLVTMVKGDKITWPSSIGIAPTEFLFFTDSQFNRLPCFNNGKDKRIPPYKIFRIRKKLLHGA
jgi:sugar lactone lactonase YvrE